MGITSLIEMGGEQYNLRVEGKNLFFIDLATKIFTTIDGMKLNKLGVIKEHPDLKDDPEWQMKAIQRLKAKLKSFNTEKEVMKYVINEMESFGWKGVYYTIDGFRPKKIKELNGN